MRFPRIILLVLFLPAGGCSYSDLISSSTGEKRVAYRSHRPQWKQPGAPSQFGRERSVQLFQGEKIRITGDKLSVTGKLGMASLLSADGYALTASHVVTGLTKMDTVLRTIPSGRAPVHAQWTTHPLRDKLGHLKSQNERVELFFYGSTVKLIGFRQITAAKIRVVKVFPHRDLALVKLPVTATHWFRRLNASPTLGSVLFASGNGATPYHGPSAGEVVAVKTSRNNIRTIVTSAPLASGDSGGPAFDASGRLVGIISHVLPSRVLPVPKLNHSSLRMADPAELQRLIGHDRATFLEPSRSQQRSDSRGPDN